MLPNAKKPQKLNKVHYYLQIANRMDGKLTLLTQSFPIKFMMVQVDHDTCLPAYLDSAGSIRYCKETFVKEKILEFALSLSKDENYLWKDRDAKDCYEIWKSRTKKIPESEISIVAWADEPNITFRRLPWIKGVSGPTPKFDAMMANTTNSEALMAWFGARFIPESYRQQYVWIYGPGGDGKGTLTELWIDVFGKAAKSLYPPKRSKDLGFWAMSLMGIRLGVFSDCDDGDFITTGFFKGITGGGPIHAEPKGKEGFNYEHKAGLIFLSNQRPNITSAKCDMRRIIYCEMEPVPNIDETTYKTELWQEMGFFITKCIETYKRLCPRNEKIKTDVEQVELIASINEEMFERCVEENFEIVGLKPYLPKNDERQAYITPTDFDRLVNGHFRNQDDAAAFRRYMERVHKIKKVEVKVNGKKVRRYIGVTSKGKVYMSNYCT